MHKFLHVELELSEKPRSNKAFRALVKQAVEENEAEFYEVMARQAQMHDMRGELVEETLEVNDVSGDSTGGVVSVSFMYSAYYGCKDIDGSDDLQDDWEFRCDGMKLIFDLEIPPERGPDEI
ncbi:hypothetical protein JN531_014810 [Flagellatimonas centrodinii]|uniref:hypothetical protein n=1 Tax=Flagellatimonas centrodinii TaxID=2806210 RepID=UPI001FFD3ADF|nr:hypothetical protein [Flagellatimonas centrodinii]ULQ46357.1 hypothetical protein JN531_014810 [Flagellatimonas centrodinii]